MPRKVAIPEGHQALKRQGRISAMTAVTSMSRESGLALDGSMEEGRTLPAGHIANNADNFDDKPTMRKQNSVDLSRRGRNMTEALGRLSNHN